MFYTNSSSMNTGCYSRRQATPVNPAATLPDVTALGPPVRRIRQMGLVAKSSRSVSVQSIEFRMERRHPKQQSSAIYGALMDKPNYSTRLPMESAFPSMRYPRKTKAEGITIVNIHNNNTNMVSDERHKNNRAPFEEMPHLNAKTTHPKSVNKVCVYPRTDPTQNTNQSPKRKKAIIPCLTTDEDRQRVFGKLPEPPILPYWHREEKMRNGKDYGDQYDCHQAKREWDRFYNQQTNEKKKLSYKDVKSPSDGSTRVEIDEETVGTLSKKVPRGLPMAKDLLKQKETRKKITFLQAEPVDHPCRPFYGTCETARISQLAMGHLVKAENELRKLEFAAGTVLPQTKVYIENITAVQSDLKKFNTNFRELQKRTDVTLGQKIGRNVTISVPKPPSGTDDFSSTSSTSSESSSSD